jgi:nucleoside-diphosphate-sugar epimerase
VIANVRRFAPSDFSGPPSLRATGVDPLSAGKAAALERLRYYAHHIESVVFVCGIFYERFSPGGMGALAIGLSSGVRREGDYILDIRRGRAQVPHEDAAGRMVHVCMTSARDVARFVVRALEFERWEGELWMMGDRMSAWDIVKVAEAVTGM